MNSASRPDHFHRTAIQRRPTTSVDGRVAANGDEQTHEDAEVLHDGDYKPTGALFLKASISGISKVSMMTNLQGSIWEGLSCRVAHHGFQRAPGEYGVLDLAADTRLAFFAEHGFPPGEFRRLTIGPVIRKDELVYAFREVGLHDTVTITFAVLAMSADGARFKLE